ncbi:MAG: ABC transporter permease [Sphingomonadaceae bacterium]
MNAGRIGAIAWLEALRLMRFRLTFTLLLVVPVLQVILFGYAIRPEGGAVSVVIASPTALSAKPIVDELTKQPGFRVLMPVRPPGGAEAAVRRGDAIIGIEIPELPSFANPTARGPARIIVDGVSPALSASAAARLEARYWQQLAQRADAGGPGLRVERLFNPEARADWTFLPALAGVTVMISMIMLGSLSVSREREGGTWETLMSLPVSPDEVLIGKVLPGTLMGTAQGIFVLGIGFWLFDLPMHGSVIALVALLPLFAAAHLVIGYAISVRAPTQLAALQGAVAVYLPAMLLSGFLYPFETLPRWAQIIGNAFPLTHFIRAAHGGVLRGEPAAMVLSHGGPIIMAILVVGLIARFAHARTVV